MSRASEAVHAPMTAAAVRVDGLVEADIRRVVGGDHAFGVIRQDCLGQGTEALLFLFMPPVVDLLDGRGLEPNVRIGQSSSALEGLGTQEAARHTRDDT